MSPEAKNANVTAADGCNSLVDTYQNKYSRERSDCATKHNTTARFAFSPP